jgi:hypothetical protein
MRWVRAPAAVGWQEVWTAEPMGQTVAPTGPTTLKVAQKAAPMARARPATVGERKAALEAN